MLLCISYLTLLLLLFSIVDFLMRTLFVTLANSVHTACGATNALKCSSRPAIHPHLHSSTRCVDCAPLSCRMSVRVSVVHLRKGPIVALHTMALHMPTYLCAYICRFVGESAGQLVCFYAPLPACRLLLSAHSHPLNFAECTYRPI